MAGELDPMRAGTRSPYSSPRARLNADRRCAAGTQSSAHTSINYMMKFSGFTTSCEAVRSAPHMEAVQAHSGCTSTRSGPSGGPSACRSKEDMPCELSILLPSIVRPSASTGCFPSSIRLPAMRRARLSALQHRADRRERLPHHRSRGRLRARASSSIEAKENTLTIRGEKQAKTDEHKGETLYQGIAARAFERVFQLADYVQVKGASLENGLLHVDLVREIPEAKKPRQIAIGNSQAARWSSRRLRKRSISTRLKGAPRPRRGAFILR